MYQIVCDKCQKTMPVEWTQMFIGWFQDPGPLKIVAGRLTRVDKRKGEWLEQLGHGSLPLPDGWQFNYPSWDDDPDKVTNPEYAHLCTDCCDHKDD